MNQFRGSKHALRYTKTICRHCPCGLSTYADPSHQQQAQCRQVNRRVYGWVIKTGQRQTAFHTGQVHLITLQLIDICPYPASANLTPAQMSPSNQYVQPIEYHSINEKSNDLMQTRTHPSPTPCFRHNLPARCRASVKDVTVHRLVCVPIHKETIYHTVSWVLGFPNSWHRKRIVGWQRRDWRSKKFVE